jgi:hypothetical protein
VAGNESDERAGSVHVAEQTAEQETIDTAVDDRDEAEEPTELATETEAEQDAAEETEEASQANTLTPALSQGAREAAVARVREAAALPVAVRERIASLVESRAEAAADGTTRVPLEAVLRAVEEGLPGFLRGGQAAYDRTGHHAGDAFFRSDASGELSDRDAEQIAHAQLSRSGLLRGQRVRVAED